MKLALTALLVICTAFGGCVSPEATRTRGGGPGGDSRNRRPTVKMHEGSQPYWKTPDLIPAEHPPLESAQQAQQMSVQ